MADADFQSLMEPVARRLFGDPNKEFSKPNHLRWGSGGSFAVDHNSDGTAWFDHEAQVGGGVIDLLMRELRTDKAGAIAWLEREGLIDKREPKERRQDRDEPPPRGAGKMKMIATYDYTNGDGDLLYQVTRWIKELPDGSWQPTKDGKGTWKTFLQRRPSGLSDRSWLWGLSGGEFMRAGPGMDWRKFDEEVFRQWPNGQRHAFPEGPPHTLYRRQRIERAIEAGKPIFLTEGEKDVEGLEEWALYATTNSGGARHWTDDMAAQLKDADVIILVDNDDAGRDGGQKKARSLKGRARRIRVLDFSEVVPNFPTKHDVSDWRKAGGTLQQLLDIVSHLPEWTPAPPKSRYGAQQFMEVGKRGTAYDWLIKGLIERAGIFMVAGEMQVGKSFFTIDMGMKIALGSDYCGRKVKKGLVIYVAGEDAKGVELRAEGYRREHALDPAMVPFLLMTKKFSLLDDKEVDAFIDECLAWEAYYGIKLELIFIDTFSVATEGLDEINGGDVGKVLGRVNRIVERTGAAVGIVHHLNARGERVRGHSSLTANVSQVIELRPVQQPQPNRNLPAKPVLDDDGRAIRQAILVKNKNGPNQTKWRFVLRQIQLGEDPDGYPITTCVCAPPAGNKQPNEETTRLTQDQKLVLRALEEAIEDQPQDMPAGVRVGPQIKRCTSMQSWYERLSKIWQFKAEDEEARKKELHDVVARVGKALINGDYIGRDNEKKIVWSLGRVDRPRRQPSAEPARPEVSEAMREAAAEGVPF